MLNFASLVLVSQNNEKQTVSSSIFEYEEKTEAAEVYVLFPQSGCVFDQLVKKLEETTLCITDVYEEVQKFNIKDASAETGQFFFSDTRPSSRWANNCQHKGPTSNRTLKFYDTVITYIL